MKNLFCCPLIYSSIRKKVRNSYVIIFTPLTKPFTIYRSSAGSGKTRTLAKEYLKLALQFKNDYFKYILAVTFTNKATQEMKDRIEHLELDHSNWHSRRLGGFPITEEEVDARNKARHRLVETHKGSGRKTMYIASHAMDVAGMDRTEGRKLIGDLIAFATQPNYIFSVSWQPGDMVMWDNLGSMHRGGAYDIDNVRRDMRRTTIREEAAPAIEDDPFGDYFKVQMAVAR